MIGVRRSERRQGYRLGIGILGAESRLRIFFGRSLRRRRLRRVICVENGVVSLNRSCRRSVLKIIMCLPRVWSGSFVTVSPLVLGLSIVAGLTRDADSCVDGCARDLASLAVPPQARVPFA